MNLTEARTILRRWREENVRKSQSVVDIYETVVAPKINKLGDEKYLVLEQVIFAAFDCHRLELARECLQALSNAFPGSIRVRLLHVLGLQAAQNFASLPHDRIVIKHGILLGRVCDVIEMFFQLAIPQLIRNVEHFQAHSRIPCEILHQNMTIKSYFMKHATDSLLIFFHDVRYDVAKDVLDSIIQADPTNPLPKKREIALYISLGKNQHAIKMLSDYLKKFMADQEAWQELASLYLIEQDYAKAAFCAEELILHDPHSHLLHQYLAEIRYTLGGFENLELARTHYCSAIKLNPNNMRALYGLLLTVTNIIASPKCTATKRKEASKLQSWVAKLIQNRYKSVGETDVKAVESLFNSLQIAKVNSSSSTMSSFLSKSSLTRPVKEKNSESL